MSDTPRPLGSIARGGLTALVLAVAAPALILAPGCGAERTGEALALAPGTETRVELFRDGRRKVLEVTLGELESENPPETEEPASSKSLGLSLRTLTPDLASRLGLDQGATGVVVTNVEPLGPAAAAGLRVRDVITRIQGEPVTGVASFKKELGRHDLDAGVRLTVLSGGAQRFAVLKAED